MLPDEAYVEEAFGILTDDDLYLDCILVKPAQHEDADLKGVRVWVPKYPLTKSSLVTCARQEVKAFGQRNSVAHLVFDLRGTGESEGGARDQDYEKDLEGIRLWAEERFGKIKLGFLGNPTIERARVSMLPLRPGVVMETYFYRAEGVAPPTVLFLATYGNFSARDEAICAALAHAGYNVYGLDPLRYLLHASAGSLLQPDDLWQDFTLLCQILGEAPIIVGQPVAAGLGLFWAAGVDGVSGVVGVGRADLGLMPPHIFDQRNKAAFLLSRYVGRIAPRPAALVIQAGPGMLRHSADEMEALFQGLGEPRRLEKSRGLTADLVLALVEWMLQVKA